MGHNKHVPILLPDRVQTVGKMRDQKACVAALCTKCRTMQKVDLEAIIQLRGRSYSLIDKRGPCRILTCDGKAIFMWATSEKAPWRPLTTDRGDMARMFPTGFHKADPDDDEPDPTPPRPPTPPVPLGIDASLWERADERERKRLIRLARG